MADRFTARLQLDRRNWLAFREPLMVLRADAADAVPGALEDVERLTRDQGLHAVGFLTYEAGAAFGLRTHGAAARLPLAWFGLYEPKSITPCGPPTLQGDYRLGVPEASIDWPAFEDAIGAIKRRLAAGDTYQVNFTFQLQADFEGDPLSLFSDLCEAQRGGHSAYLDLGDSVICSASPELFFELCGPDIVARPMKGTARRGLTLDSDRAAGQALAASAKERAENVMVVDMVRNDLGRIADVGTVSVPRLFEVERYPNVWQMTSDVRARTSAPLASIFAALFPCASVTGAPKVRTMELLNGLEHEPRGIYTGAIGHVPPDGMARFNVAIRTAQVDRRAGRLSFGVGSGVVWDSEAASEYAECLVKGAVLGRRHVPFELLETLRWTPGDGYYLLERHFDRLRRSAEYFVYDLPRAHVREVLDQAVAGATSPLRVRLVLSRDGQARAESEPLVESGGPVRVRLAANPVEIDDPFLYHKTTRRSVYEQARAQTGDCDDVILWNRDGEVTETTVCNLVVLLNGQRTTPPVSSGLLAGTLREDLLASGSVREGVITVDALRRASRIWLINSVRGEREAVLVNV